MSGEEELKKALAMLRDTVKNAWGIAPGNSPAVVAAVSNADRVLHPAESFYSCPTCGENVTRYGQRCKRCERDLEHDRLERESGR